MGRRVGMGMQRGLALQVALLLAHIVLGGLRFGRWLASVRVFDISLAQWFASVEMVVLVWNVFHFGVAQLVSALEKTVQRTENSFDNAIIEVVKRYTTDAKGIRLGALASALFYAALLPLDLQHVKPALYENVLICIKLIFGINVIDALWNAAILLLRIFTHESDYGRKHVDEKRAESVLRFLKPVFFGIGLIFLADNVGLQVESLIASLGIGGLTLALSTQALLQDVFAALVLFIDQPFKEGDFIRISGEPNAAGTVEKIGLKSTIVRSSDGEQLIYSNKDVSGARIARFDVGMSRRKIATWRFDLRTRLDALLELPRLLEQVVTANKCEFFAAYLKEVREEWLEFELVYRAHGQTYVEFVQRQHAINVGVLQALEKAGVFVAVPIRRMLPESAARVDSADRDLSLAPTAEQPASRVADLRASFGA